MPHPPKPDFQSLAFQFFNEVAIIDQLGNTRLERVLPDGLSIAGFGLLNHFVRLDLHHETPSQLAKAFQVTKGAMTNTIQRLAAKGWIEIEAAPEDGRSKRVKITQAGRATRDAALASLVPSLNQLAELIDGDDIAALLPSLMKIRTILDTNREP
ncbi:multiple antibiotic resistance protein MarR [Candidatus Phycosocius bacilliformis]|uniref:Multiple antibiotic resistance protein MarR n=1 Tax=Candidatus Phycosocius bacilliformis TaxID=1445552 RepID=A0A2P2E7E0_9PROT|nr:MarR family transcriptional regulator [Candidatus Phycosocius bacilliformis]GBF56976.1 multiple antibiotic resistance protein MarR [Candidatus Phycosocius bacilliformis]